MLDKDYRLTCVVGNILVVIELRLWRILNWRGERGGSLWKSSHSILSHEKWKSPHSILSHGKSNFGPHGNAGIADFGDNLVPGRLCTNEHICIVCTYMYVKESLPRKVSNGGVACNRCKGIVSNDGVYVCTLYIVQFCNVLCVYHSENWKISNMVNEHEIGFVWNAQYTALSPQIWCTI